MRLDIVVPHYKEPWETCEYLFDSIKMQRGIPFTSIKVIVVNDGDCLLDEEHFKKYPYEIEYLVKEHGGVSAARNYGLDHSDADFVMFCDIDDGFLSNFGLHLMFSAMQEGFDLMISNFVEETYDAEGNFMIVPHDRDATFMHGKCYRREFLVENDLRFDPSLTIHEDGYFNMLVYAEVEDKGKLKVINTPFYLWRWNDNSTVRSNRSDFVLRTYDQIMSGRKALCREMKRRGLETAFVTSVGMTVLNSFYDFQKGSYYLPRNEKYLRIAMKEFKSFWLEFKDVFENTNNKQIAEMAKLCRDTAYKEGMLYEGEDIRSFLKRVENS